MKDSPTWKWIVVAICLPLIGFLGSSYFNSYGSDLQEIKSYQQQGFAIVHKRLNDLDEEKVDKNVLTECIRRLDEKIDYLIKISERRK